MDLIMNYLFSYPAIILVASICIGIFILMIIKKTLKAVVMLILFAILTAMVVVKVTVVDKKQISEVRDSMEKTIKKKVKDVSD